VISTRFFAISVRALVAILLVAGPCGQADAQDTAATQVVGVCGDDGGLPDGIVLQTVAIHRAAPRQDRDPGPALGKAAEVGFSPERSGSRILVTSRVGPPVTRRSSAPPTGPPRT
jgi:hypothetical protein